MGRINTFLLWEAQQIAADTLLAAWANSNFGQKVKVFIGWDDRRLPTIDECPMVALLAGIPSMQPGYHVCTHQSGVRFALYREISNKEGEFQHESSGDIYTMPALALIEEFRWHLTRIILKPLRHTSGEYCVKDLSIAGEDDVSGPMARAALAQTIEMQTKLEV